MNTIDKEALDHAKWLSDYCRKHNIECDRCAFNKKDQKNVYNGVACMLKRASADQWFGGLKITT